MKRYHTILMTLLLSVVVCAEPLTLDSCLRLAKENNADIRISQLEIDKAKEVKAQVFTKFFPQVSGTFLAYHALNPIVVFGIKDIQSEDAREVLQALYNLVKEESDINNEIALMRHGLSLSATAVQPVFVGGRIVNGNKLAGLGVESAELKAQISERDILENIESSYYLVLGLQDKVKTIESALTLLDSLTHTVDVALRAGLVTKSDALQVELKKNEMRAAQLQLSNGIELASRLLCVQIGIDYPENGLSLIDEQQPIGPISLSLPVENADRPERKLLQLQVKAEELKKKMAIGEALPPKSLSTFFLSARICACGNICE